MVLGPAIFVPSTNILNITSKSPGPVQSPQALKKLKEKNTLLSYISMGFQALCDWDAIEVHGPNEAVEEMSIISIGNDPALLRCLRMKWCRIVPTACWL
jgi:hypothetical protein